MTNSLPNFPFEICVNAKHDPSAPYGPRQQSVVNLEGFRKAKKTISSWPGFATTPLVNLPGLAKALGLGSIHYKQEAGRFGLGSFKALGGAYAVAQLLVSLLKKRKGTDEIEFEQILSGHHADDVSEITVCCATDGNHGRSVAWGAQTFGCKCVIFIHATVSEGRKKAIEAYGAEVVRTAGNYDDSVHHANKIAEENGWFVVSDTSYEGYMDVPRDVMQGYTVMAGEMIEQFSGGGAPTHLVLQTGVGGMAAAVCAQYWETFGKDRPQTILVDPDQSACWLESVRAGEPTVVGGDLDTIMAGLACGEISLLAWKVLEAEVRAVMTVDDPSAAETMRILAEGRYGDAPLVAGESAVAGLTALIAVAGDEDARGKLGLSNDSHVVLLGSEGDTDADVYKDIVGKTSAEVLGG